MQLTAAQRCVTHKGGTLIPEESAGTPVQRSVTASCRSAVLFTTEASAALQGRLRRCARTEFITPTRQSEQHRRHEMHTQLTTTAQRRCSRQGPRLGRSPAPAVHPPVQALPLQAPRYGCCCSGGGYSSANQTCSNMLRETMQRAEQQRLHGKLWL
jgi:hypothetical protein